MEAKFAMWQNVKRYDQMQICKHDFVLRNYLNCISVFILLFPPFPHYSQRHGNFTWLVIVCEIVKVLVISLVSNSLQPHRLQPARLLCPWRFSRQEYWSELPCSPLGDLPNPEIEPTSLTAPALAGGFFTTSATWEVPKLICMQSTKCYQ